MHKSIDKVIDAKSQLHFRFSHSFSPSKLSDLKEGQTDSETESDNEIKFAKERLLSLSPRSFMNSCILIKDYEETGTQFERKIKKMQKNSSSIDLVKIRDSGGQFLINGQLDG